MIQKGGNIKDMEEFYTVEEITKSLKMSRPTIMRYLKKGLLSGIKVPGRGKGGALRFRQRDIDVFTKKCAFRIATS